MKKAVFCASSDDYMEEHKPHKYVVTKKVEIKVTTTEKTPYIKVWGRKVYITRQQITGFEVYYE